MKKLILLSLLAVACAAHKPLPEVPQFDKVNVCSDASLAYFAKQRARKPMSPQFHTEAEIQNRMIGLEPHVRQCYEELLQINKEATFNLCFVVGYDLKGKQEYFEFSTKEFNMPEHFKACLNTLKMSKELEGLKNVSVLQPFRLYPVR